MSAEGYAAVNRTRLYYEVSGRDRSGEGGGAREGDTPVVFVHGFTLDTRMWDTQMAAFGERYPVVRYDARGFGKSAMPVEGEEYAHEDDLVALLEHLGIAKAHVIGLSMGGSIVTRFALAYPEATASLVLVDAALDGYVPKPADEKVEPAASGTSAAPAPPRRRPPGEVAKSDGVPAAREVWLQSGIFAPANEQPEVAAALRAIVDDYSGWAWLYTPKNRLWDPPVAQRLGEIRARTLVIVGDRDVEWLIEMSEALANGIPGARLVVLPGIGHMANMEAPAAFNKIVLEFLAEAATTSDQR